MKQYLTLLLLPVLLLVGFFAYHLVQRSQVSEPPSMAESLDMPGEPPTSLPASGKPSEQSAEPAEPSSEPEQVEREDTAEPKSENDELQPSSPSPEKGDVPPAVQPGQTQYQDKVLTKPGIFGGETTETYENIVVKTGGVTLKNLSIRGDLVVDKSLTSASVSLENITILGTLSLGGGEGNSFSLKNVSVSQMEVGALNCTTSLKLSGNIAVDRMEIQGDLTAEGSGIVYETQNSRAVSVLEIPQLKVHRVYVELSCLTVRDLNVRNIATVTLGNYSTVETANLYTRTNLCGPGAVGTLNAFADGITYETPPVQVEAASGVEYPKDSASMLSLQNGGKYKRLEVPANLSVSFVEETGEYMASWEAVEGAAGYRLSWYVDGRQENTQQLPPDTLYCSLLSETKDAQKEFSQLRVEIYALGTKGESLDSFISSKEISYDSL